MLKNIKLYQAILIVAFLLFGYCTYDYYTYSESRSKKTNIIGKEKSGEIRAYLNNQVKYIEEYTNEITEQIASQNYSSEELIQLVIKRANESKLGLGITVAFEPYKFDPDTILYAKYYDLRQQRLIDIASLYDYTDRNLETTSWYTNIIESKGPKWSDAYFAKGANQLVADYGSPIYRIDSNGEKEIVGMVSFTIALERFSRYINTLSLGNSGYGILSTKQSQILAHPKTEYINNSAVSKQLLSKVPELKRLETEQEGFIEFYSEYSFQESLLYFSALENDWILSVVFTENDLVGPAEYLDNKLIHIAIMISLIILLSLFIILKGYEGNTRNMWIISIVFSLLCFINIAFIWYLNISLNNSRSEAFTNKITTQTELRRALIDWNTSAQKIGYPPAIEIPTGLYISDIQFTDDYDVAVSGKVWQKINDSLEINHDLNFVFPQKSPVGLSVRTEIVSKTHVADYWLLRYNFNATLSFDFDYSQYPLDYRMLNIQLMYPDIHENRILVPDLQGYSVLNPGKRPGYDVHNFVPEAYIISTHYSFARQDFNSNLGNINYRGPSDSPVLEFNISVKRNVLNPVISNILPILVIAILMFLLTFTIHKENGEIVEGSALSVIQAFGGFFFVLLLAHIQLRNNLLAPEISYLETYYFLMYSAIALVSSGMLLYVKTNHYTFLEYKNNILLKLIFWPFLLSSIYLITIFTFY